MQYSKEVIDHFQNPRNVGEIKDADGVGTVGNRRCGDIMEVFIKVGKKDKTEYIEDIKFKTLGCAAAIATSSMMTELARGKTLDEAYKVSRYDINEALGNLPAPKYHCSVLADNAIKAAIDDYRKKKEKKSE